MPATFEYAGRDLESMGFATRYHRHILTIFRPYLGRQVAEVGAGDGSVSELIAEVVPGTITAIEPSPNMYVLLKRRGGRIKPRHGFLADFANLLRGDPPDSFVYINVFEHIDDDVAEMRRVHGLLPAGGHLCIFVPALPGLYSDFDRSIDHFRRYRKPDLEAKCRSAGFTIVESRYFDLLGVLPWWLRFRVFKSKTLNPAAVKAYDAVGVPIIKTLESVIRPPLGKNVLLIARKG